MSLTTRLFASIQTRLLGVFFINIMLTVAIVIAFNQTLRTQLIDRADDALLVNAAQIANRIDEFNRSNRQVFNTGSKLPSLIDFLQADEGQRENLDFRARTRATLDSLEIEPWDEYYVLSQAIIDRNGLNILDTEKANIGTNEAEQPYFRAALLGGGITISPIQYRPERSGIYFYYAVPLRESAPPHVALGVLRIQIAIASIQNIVFDSVRGQNLHVALFDENYVRVVDTQYEDLLFRSITNFSAEQIADLKSQYALPPLPDENVSMPVPELANILNNTHANHVVSGHTGPNANEERLAIIKLETVPWYMVVSQPTKQHYKSVQQQTRGTLILTGTLTLIALMSSYLISSHIAKPIRTLTNVARQVANGDLHVKAAITTSDEIGVLAQTFNLMTTELEIAQATLEERVKQRTQELLETNEKLKHEIVERQRYEQQALELALEHERRRILADFIQKASHEFKTPLSIINVKSYVVKRFLSSENQQHMQVIEDQGRYIEGLINRMVLMSRLDSGVATPTKYLQIDDFLRTVYASRADAFQAKQAVAHLNLHATDAWIYANPELLSIAIQNILDNALKFSEAPVEISLTTSTRDGTITIIIADNGIGVPKALQARVFERFFRVDEAHTTRGFGLGLPIAKRIIENTGGTIEFVSQEGHGSTVTITLTVQTGEQPPHWVTIERYG